jgi:dTDP-glucose 4,6-dehydratase
MPIRVLITGGAAYRVELYQIRARCSPEWQIVNFDLLTYAGNPANLEGIPENDKYRFLKGD